ncbi:MAG: CDP-glucose 4,6-dehydratase [Chloroflexi bacterium]|nr:CDP-glucose 4,6-dehydratase [Chloroflexota bacterium]
MNPFNNFYRGKTVFVTGHTGFKGSWLAIWLTHLGAKVIGYALEPPSDPNNFTACQLETRITHIYGDIRDYERLSASFKTYKPEIVFHLAAQSLVRLSFSEPRRTFDVNLMGTVNVLEAARQTESVRAAVMITSDKCYRNVNWEWGYRETDELGGYDAYSASKACAEMAIASYQDPRFQKSADPSSDLLIASARAGNVIGGGDWARDRIIPDTIRAIVSATDIEIRSPNATRPWQHVLEPLSGYLWLGALLGGVSFQRQAQISEVPDARHYCTSWNFGPAESRVLTVKEVVAGILDRWQPDQTRLVIKPDHSGAESLLLRLDCSKAHHHLKWHTTWDIDHTLNAIVGWYQAYYNHNYSDKEIYQFTLDQIAGYVDAARELGLPWAQPAT